MKKDLVKEIFDGNYCPSEQIVIVDPEYKKLKDKIYGEWNYFERKMTGSDQERVLQLQDLIADMQHMESLAFYREGIGAGIKLAQEPLS